MRRLLLVLLLPLVVLLTACGGSGGSSGGDDTSGTSVGVGPGNQGELTWGDGDYGVVLAHGAAFDAASWEDQATAIADAGATVVALEDIAPEAIAAAVTDLRDDGIEQVALIGGSAGADAILRLGVEQPELADQLILLSPNTVVEGLGDQPKLFVASEGEPGTDVPAELEAANPGEVDVLIVGGSAHAQNVFDTDQGAEVLDAILERIPG